MKRLLLTITLSFLFALGSDPSAAQNMVGDYSRIQEKMETSVILMAGYPTSKYKVSESRTERNGSNYSRRFVANYEYRLVAYAPPEASQVRLTVTCDGSSPMRRTSNGSNVSLSFRLSSSKTCRVKSEVVQTSAPDVQHFVGMIILFNKP